MRFGVFHQHQVPRPWGDGAERRVLEDALEQVEIADEVGFDCAWAVEHHFAEELSHSSAPEVFLAAASQRTERIRLGHGIVQLPHQVNPPVRVAERVATLDLISDGRLELGTGEGTFATELGGFGIDRARQRRQWADALDAITRMFVEEPFAGWDSEWLHMPPRNVVPKPLQKPHPPLWVACLDRDMVRLAARRGLGALCLAPLDPEEAALWVRDYYRLLESPACVPAGFAVNPAFALVVPMMCHRDEQAALERGLDGASFSGYALAHYYGLAPHAPGRTHLHRTFGAHGDPSGNGNGAASVPPGVELWRRGFGNRRGAIGTPEQIRRLAHRYEKAGVDQLCFELQTGGNRHYDICESLELFAEEVLPEFAETAEEREAARLERLAAATGQALARRLPPRSAPRCVVNEAEEVRRTRAASRVGAGPWGWLTEAILGAAASARQGARDVLRRVLRGMDAGIVDGHFGPLAQRAFFTAMALSIDAERLGDFCGDVVWELRSSNNGTGPNGGPRWTMRLDGRHASLRPGDSPSARVRLSLPSRDFLRILGGEEGPARSFLEGRLRVEGDLLAGIRLVGLFGDPRVD